MYSNNFLFFVHDGAKIQVKLDKVHYFPQNLKEIAEIYLLLFSFAIYLPLLKILHKMHVQCPHEWDLKSRCTRCMLTIETLEQSIKYVQS